MAKDEIIGVKDLVDSGQIKLEDALLMGLFDKQMQLILDPSTRKAAVCGRRGGKSTVAPRYLIREAMLWPGTTQLYIALTRRNAERLMWSPLKNCLDEYGIVYHSDENNLEIEFANGSQIWLAGADKTDEIEKFRSFAFRLVILDECASYGQHFEELIEDVLDPCLGDLNGTMLLIGTPGKVCAGHFYDLTCESGELYGQYSLHHWTLLDNPRFPRWAGQPDWRDQAVEFMRQKRRDKKWSIDNPVYLREWMGQWVRNNDSLVYRFRPVKNAYEGGFKKTRGTQYVLGIDLGYEDLTSWVIWAFNPAEHGHIYEAYEYGQSNLTVSAIAEITKSLQEQYHPVVTVADSGGLGKMIIEEMAQRHGIQLEPAKKDKKLDYIELMNSDLHEGRIKVIADGELAREWIKLPWDKDGKEHPKFPNHFADAALYAWRAAYHWSFTPEKIIEPGSIEAVLADEQRMFDENQREIEAEGEEKIEIEPEQLDDDMLAAIWEVRRNKSWKLH